jgi:hypothetical protein
MNDLTLKLAKRLQKLVEQHKEIEESLLKERCMELAIDERCDLPALFLWKYLQRPNREPLSLQKEYECFPVFPELSLACLLEPMQENLSPSSLMIHQSEDNKLNYCISGSISLDELQRICEYHLSAGNPTKTDK